MSRFCKNCAYLATEYVHRNGRLSEPKDQIVYRCTWFDHNLGPWAMMSKPTKVDMQIAERFVNPDWVPSAAYVAAFGDKKPEDSTETMDCPAFRAREVSA